MKASAQKQPNYTHQMTIKQLTSSHIDRDLSVSLSSKINWQFLLLIEGSAKILINGQQQRLTAGSLLSLPTTTHCQIIFSDNSASGFLLTIDEIIFRTQIIPLLPGNLDRRSSYWRNYYTARVLAHSEGTEHQLLRRNTVRELSSLASHLGKGGDPAIMGTALVILFSPLKHRQLNPNEGEISQSEAFSKSYLVIEFRALVEQHFAEQLKVSQYAEILGVSPKMLIRACKTMTGDSPVEIIHKRVVTEAVHQLNHSSRSISEIAYNLGFEDAGYFSRFIKEQTEQSPTDIRRQVFQGSPHLQHQ